MISLTKTFAAPVVAGLVAVTAQTAESAPIYMTMSGNIQGTDGDCFTNNSAVLFNFAVDPAQPPEYADANVANFIAAYAGSTFTTTDCTISAPTGGITQSKYGSNGIFSYATDSVGTPPDARFIVNMNFSNSNAANYDINSILELAELLDSSKWAPTLELYRTQDRQLNIYEVTNLELRFADAPEEPGNEVPEPAGLALTAAALAAAAAARRYAGKREEAAPKVS